MPCTCVLAPRPQQPGLKGHRLARARGGPDAERAERERACNEAAEQERRNFDALQRMRCEGFRKVALPQQHSYHGFGFRV